MRIEVEVGDGIVTWLKRAQGYEDGRLARYLEVASWVEEGLRAEPSATIRRIPRIRCDRTLGGRRRQQGLMGSPLNIPPCLINESKQEPVLLKR